jgi:molecular chaperone DnaK
LEPRERLPGRSTAARDGKRPPILGIDLGTSTSLACVLLDGQAEPLIIKPHPELPDYQAPWLPSVVCLTDTGAIVGEPARLRYGDDQSRQGVIACVKRDMGLQTKTYSTGKPGAEKFSPAQISSFILAHLRNAAANQLRRPASDFTEAVITVPADFGQVERKATLHAGELAGFTQVHLLDEPIAAAMSLLTKERRSADPKLIMVVDLGGGTLDVTLLLAGAEIPDGGINELARDGNQRLGGIDWDKAIAIFALAHSHPQWRERSRDTKFVDPSNLAMWDPCEAAKKDLSSKPLTEVTVGYMDYHDLNYRRVRLTKEDFLQITQGLTDKCIKVCNRLVANVPPQELARLVRKRRTWKDYFRSRRVQQLTWRDVDDIYLVGGGSRVPTVREAIQQCWRKEPKLDSKAELRVAYGAALCAAALSENPELFSTGYLRCPHAIGVFRDVSSAPARRLLGSLLGKRLPANGNGTAFETFIAKNQRIPDTVARRYRLVGNDDDDTYVVEVVEEHRDWDKPAAEQVKYQHLGQLEIHGLPVATSAEDRVVKLEFHYLSDRDVRLYATIRGIRREKFLKSPGAAR